MKKALPIIAVVALMFGIYGLLTFRLIRPDAKAAEPYVTLYVSPATQTITTGSTSTLQIRLKKDSSAKVDYVNASMTFPPAYFEVVSLAKQGSYFNANGGPTSSYDNAKGTISIKGNGEVLPTTADVLVGTITLRSKATGVTSLSYAADSQAGSITNGGHVKDALTSKTGASITITNAPPPQNATDPDEPVDDGGEGDGSEDEIVTGSEESAGEGLENEEESGAASESTGAGSSDSQPSQSGSGAENGSPVVASVEPFWKKYLWPIVGGGLLVVGAGVVGLTLVLKRRKVHGGVVLPPLTEGIEDPGAEAAAEEPLYSIPTEPQDEVAEDETVAQVAEELTQSEAQVPVDATPVASPEPVKEAVSQQASVQPPVSPPAIIAAPAPAPAIQPQPVQPQVQQPVARNTTDYANLPDMFDLGEQRLRDEGLSDMKSKVIK